MNNCDEYKCHTPPVDHVAQKKNNHIVTNTVGPTP